MFSSPVLTLLWSYLSFSEKVYLILGVVFAVHGMCASIYWVLATAVQKFSKVQTDILWSLEQIYTLLAWTGRVCTGLRNRNVRATPRTLAAAPLAMPVWPPQVAHAQGRARRRSPGRGSID